MGRPQEEAQTLACRSLEGEVFKQPALVSYNQGFMTIALDVLCFIPMVFLLKHRKAPAQAGLDAHSRSRIVPLRLRK